MAVEPEPDHVLLVPYDVGKCGDAVSPTDYACVRRCRQRRLATYLWLHGFRATLRGLLTETDAFMSAAHLSGLVRQGLWEDAVVYLSRFLLPTSRPRSDEAQVLINFLKQQKSFAGMLAGVDSRDLNFLNKKYNTRYLKHDAAVSHDDLRIRSIVLSLLNSPQVRASLDWDRVRHKASQIVYDLAFKAPELKDLALLPGGSMLPQHVLPLGLRSSRRRYVKEPLLKPKILTENFLRTKKRLPSPTHSHELNTRLTDKAKKWLVDIIDESLQAGSLELQSTGKKDVPGATISHTMPRTSSLANADVPGATISHTMPRTSSLANAGVLVAPVSQIMSGAPVAAVSQTVNLTSHAENSGISAVISAGTSKILSLENSNLRKHPRTEEIIFEHKKMQRASGAFGEACLASVSEGEAGAGSHA